MRHSFKYLSDDDPISISYVVFTDSSSPSTPAEPILNQIDNLDPIIEPAKDLQYSAVPLARALANVKFAYLHIGKNFVENSTKLFYIIHHIVRVISSSSLPTLCLQFYDIISFLLPPADPSLFEYELIQ